MTDLLTSYPGSHAIARRTLAGGEHTPYEATELANAVRKAARIAWHLNQQVQPHDVR